MITWQLTGEIAAIFGVCNVTSSCKIYHNIPLKLLLKIKSKETAFEYTTF